MSVSFATPHSGRTYEHKGQEPMNIDLQKHPDSISEINKIVNSNNIAEVKAEKNGKRIVVVEINRTLRHSKEIPDNE